MNNTLPDFEYVRDLIRQISGMVIEKGKEYLIENRLSSITREQGFESISALIYAARHDPSRSRLQSLIVDALTINETSFFRDARLFDHLKNTIIPNLIETNKELKTLSIWSGASSSGQEIYSLAILLKENFPELNNWTVQLFASDISYRILQQAQKGIYTDFEVRRGIPDTIRDIYFDQTTTFEWRVKERIRKMVKFETRNLVEEWPNFGKFDIILLRNVMIYFDIEQKKAILNRLKKHLWPGGHLLLGSSETTYNIDPDWESENGNVPSFRLKEEPTLKHAIR